MNNEDINTRIKRLYLSVEATIDEDIPTYINVKHEQTENDGRVSVSFSSEEDIPEILNQIFLVISNLAKLKDHLKRKLKSRNIDQKLFIDEIKNSEHLKLVLDLDNLEKHGPGKDSWSGRFPKIINVGRAITQKDVKSQEPSIFEFSTSGKIKWNSNTVIVNSGTVVDKDGEIICGYNELVNKSTDAWETIIQKFNLRDWKED